MLRTVVAASAFAVLALSGAANAQPSDYRTIFTFNQPLSLPGMTLPAGSYTFRIVNEHSASRVVQVLSADGTTSYALLQTQPLDRQVPSPDPELELMETPQGYATAIRAWWYPGTRTGFEFVYPRPQASWLARATTTPVMTTTDAGEAVRASSSGGDIALN